MPARPIVFPARFQPSEGGIPGQLMTGRDERALVGFLAFAARSVGPLFGGFAHDIGLYNAKGHFRHLGAALFDLRQVVKAGAWLSLRATHSCT